MASSFERRISYFVTCVIPSRVLIDAESTSGLSFIRVQRQLDAVYLVRVASSAEQFATAGGWYTELLSEDQLRYARPCQRRGYQFAEELLDTQEATLPPARRVVPDFEPDPAIGVFELPASEVAQKYSQMSEHQPVRSMQSVLLYVALIAVQQILSRDQQASAAVQERAERLAALRAREQHGERVARSTIVRRGKREVWQVQFAA